MIKLLKIGPVSIITITLLLLNAIGCKVEQAADIPIVTTVTITNVTAVALTSGGVVTSDGGSKITGRGVCWSTSKNPTIFYMDSITSNGTGTGVFSSAIKGLKPATKYYIRAYASNSAGTGYGNELNSMYSVIPTVTTSLITVVSDSIIVSGGNITNDGGLTVTSRGVCWSNSKNPTLANSFISSGVGSGNFNVTIANLSPDALYYIRAYASNSLGTAYGNERFFTIGKLVVKDKDGNYYHILYIGSQVWLGENLKTTRFRDSTLIPMVDSNSSWNTQITPGYCWYDNDQVVKRNTYGGLYNWQAVTSGKLCPTGWHVPSDTEWTTLADNMGGESQAGNKLKESGTDHWRIPNSGANNETMFTALPGGYRTETGVFDNLGNYGNWWSTTSVNSTVANYRYMYYGNGTMTKSFVNQKYGLSVRCLKN